MTDTRTLRERLEQSDEFVTVTELVPWRGLEPDAPGRRSMDAARALAGDPRIAAISITDNAGGHAMTSPAVLADDLLGRGQDVIVHVACRDRSRNALLSLGWELERRGVRNVLCVSGDYPVEGLEGLSRPVFDVDSVGLLALYRGLSDEPGPAPDGHAPGLYLGAAVSPFKRTEAELLPQYGKLALKVRAGADFIIPQLGYDSRKWDELLRWMRGRDLRVPVLANVYVLSRFVARLFHANQIPGCVVSDELLALAEREAAAPDKGRAFFLELAARQVAIARGLGFRGAYLAGSLSAADVDRILATAAAYGPDDWRTFAREIRYASPGTFHLYAPDPDSGLNTDAPDPAYARSTTPRSRSRARRRVSPAYRFSRLTHDLVFDPEIGRLRGGGPDPRADRAVPPGSAVPRHRAGDQDPDVRLPRLRRLLAARGRLPVPGVAVPQGHAQRAVRRLARRHLRVAAPPVHLGPRLRATQAVRRRARHARSTAGPGRQRAAPDERLDEHVPGARPCGEGGENGGRRRARGAGGHASGGGGGNKWRAGDGHEGRAGEARRGEGSMTDTPRGTFLVVGENLHATRVLLRSGARVSATADGRPALPFDDEDGAARLLPVPDGAIEGTAEKGKVRHVKAAILAGLAGGPDAGLARGYVRFLARRQAEAGSDWLDLNVDEVSTDVDTRAAAIRWLVGAVEDATAVPLSLDSSAAEVMRAGLAAMNRSGGKPLLNSASLERLDVLDLASAEGCAVVLSASGGGGMPANAAERVANGHRIVEAAASRGLTLGALHVDPLVLPVAVEPDAGRAFLDALGALRRELGLAVHLTGGLSNVSFGLPARKLLNDVMISLAAEAGADAGIIDPVANPVGRAFGQERSARPYALAAALLTGADPFGGDFLAAYRAGELA